MRAQTGAELEFVSGSRADALTPHLARHFIRAGDSAAVRAKALRYSLQAGKRAADLSAYPDSLAHFNRAWEIIEHNPRASLDVRREGLRGRGWAEANLAQYAASDDSLRE